MARLYYADSYTTKFNAHIQEIIPTKTALAVVLDQTYFYPTSGGQPHDTGNINGIPVIDVQVSTTDGIILHLVASDAKLTLGDAVCEVNWERRFDHMQHHSGQHLLSQAFTRLTEAETVGFHMSDDTITIDLDTLAISSDQLSRVEALTNAMIIANLPVSVQVVAHTEIGNLRMRKIPDVLATDGLRIVSIGEFDICACGGTHVSRTGEIGLLKIVKTEKKGEKLRVEFKCGSRAVADYTQKHAIVTQLASDFTVGTRELIASISSMREVNRDSQTRIKALQHALISYESADLIAQAEVQHGYRRVTALFDERDPLEIRLLASTICTSDDTIATFATHFNDRWHLIYGRSAALPHDMNALLKAHLARLQAGKGGGQPTFAQGNALGSKTEILALLNEPLQSP
jgi:alanyl-tRNA synthetase